MKSPSMIALKSEFAEKTVNLYDRPGDHEVARLKEATDRTIEALDTPADMLAEALNAQLAQYKGPLPMDRESLRIFILEQFHSAAGPTAISAMLAAYHEEDFVTRSSNLLRRVLVLIGSQRNPALTCQAISIATGTYLGEGKSLEEIAKMHGITKQALSKRTIRICQELDLPPSRLMRSKESRESYRLKQRQRHAAARDAGLGNGSISSLKANLASARERVNGFKLRRSA